MRVKNDSYMHRPTCRRLVWITFSRFTTFFIPNFILLHVGGLKTSMSRQAWREKIALFFLFLLSAAFVCFWLEYISSLFCDPERAYDYDHVFANDSKLSQINGKAVNWHRYEGPPNPAIEFVNLYPHQDLSPNFPRFLMFNRSSPEDMYADDNMNACVFNQGKSIEADNWFSYLMDNQSGYKFDNDQLTSCPIPGQVNVTGAPCFHGPAVYDLVEREPVQGDIKYDPDQVYRLYNTLPSPGNLTRQAYVILDGYVLDVTLYLSIATNIIPLSSTMSSRSFAVDRMFLPVDLTLFLFINLGKDITTSFAGNVTEDTELYRKCLVRLFQKGVVSSHVPDGCARINPALWATMGAGLLYFLIKMSLAYLSRVPFIQQRLFSSAPESSYRSSTHHVWPHSILMVPCFSESSDILRQTLETLSRSAYKDSHKMLLFVCDGITTSATEQKETHVLLLENLGHSCTDEPLPLYYTSLGQGKKRVNCARVYSGFYETGRNRVPYLVIVKVGQPHETVQSKGGAPPGNRGKRDSLMLVLGFLERCMNLANNRITPLEYEVFNQCYNVLGIDPRNFKYLMVTDADIQVQEDVVQKLVSRLEGDRNMLAVSGHVRPANPEDNLTTMLQIFPCYMTFYSGLAYEACLKSVMTIQGGLVMYKVWTENVPLLEQQNSKFLKKWKLLQQHSANSSQQSFGGGVNQQSQYNKWPKLSDEIIITNPFNDPAPPNKRSSSSETMLTTTTTSTSTSLASHQPVHRPPLQHHASSRPESKLSLTTRVDIRPCCVHPTVLRGIATPQANTMHMQNVLLLGEEKIMPLVLLKSHPGHRLGFEPDAVGYATLPTNFFSLQGLQTRNFRAAFHNQLEMQRASWQLGFTYWVLSTTEILDMIFSMPIIVYLYGIFVRSVRYRALSYTTIASAFTGLVVLHILFFLFRRQFRYIVWFVLYCLISLPLFAIWFPLLAAWQNDKATYWHDVWPSKTEKKGWFTRRSRLHGILDAEQDLVGEEKRMDENTIPRMRLAEFEVIEATRLHQAAEAALDSNFTGFTDFENEQEDRGHPRLQSPTAYEPDLVSPPMAQVRDGVHSTRIIPNYRPSSGEYGTAWRRRYPNENPDLLNPFSDPTEINPFDDGFQVSPMTRGYSDDTTSIPLSSKHRHLQHKPSHSQSSYFTSGSRSSFQADTPTRNGIHFNETTAETLPSSLNSSGFAKVSMYPDRYFPQEDLMMTDLSSPPVDIGLIEETEDANYQFDRASTTLSIKSNTFSIFVSDDAHKAIQEEEQALPRHQRLLESLNSDQIQREAIRPEEGRSIALHNFNNSSNVNLRQHMDKAAPTRRLLTKDGISSSNSLSHHFRNMSDSNNNGLSLRPSKASLLNNDLSNMEQQQVIKAEIRNYLMRSDLQSTTRTQVKAHLIKHFGSAIINENDDYLTHCIEETTLEFLE